jgi:hypothetical protein
VREREETAVFSPQQKIDWWKIEIENLDLLAESD